MNPGRPSLALALASVLFTAALFEAWRVARFLAGSQHAVGLVERVDSPALAEGGIPLWIRFEDANGVSYRLPVREDGAGNLAPLTTLSPGDGVPLRFAPHSPACTAVDPRPRGAWRIALALGAGGLALACAGIALRSRPYVR